MGFFTLSQTVKKEIPFAEDSGQSVPFIVVA